MVGRLKESKCLSCFHLQTEAVGAGQVVLKSLHFRQQRSADLLENSHRPGLNNRKYG
jgi:hypothetical protein